MDLLQQLLLKPLLELEGTTVTVRTVLYFVLAIALLLWATGWLRRWLVQQVLDYDFISEKLRDRLANVIYVLVAGLGFIFILDRSELDVTAVQIFRSIDTVLSETIIPLGKTSINLATIIYVVLACTLLVVLTGKLQQFIVRRVFAGSTIDIGVRQATATIIRYVVVVLGFVVILQMAGVDLSTLTVLAGALGLGLSFGLQNITANFVSGLIILFERPIKVGDRIEVDGIGGDIVKISLRAVTVRTNDNIEIIVPNSDFIQGKVTNWSHTDRDVRLGVPVGVSYRSDPKKVRDVLLAAAEEHPGVLKNPSPIVIFEGFGDSSLQFALRVFTRDYSARPGILRSELNFIIFEKFQQEGIEIPFPQRDVHIRSGWPAELPKDS